MKNAASIILALALADEQTLRDIEEFCAALMVKSPMDDPAFVAKLDERMSVAPTSANSAAKTSESGSEFSPEVPEDTKKKNE